MMTRAKGALIRLLVDSRPGPHIALVLGCLAIMLTGAVYAKDLSYDDFQRLTRAVHRLDHLAMSMPTDADVGMNLIFGDRLGLVHAFYLTDGESEEVWKSRQLEGFVDEVLVADLDGDGFEDTIIGRTSAAKIYLWDVVDFSLKYESLTNDFEKIHCMTIGNVDDDEAVEIIVNADNHLHYIDGLAFNREWTSLQEYEATRVVCGDVDGDRNNEIVLNNGQVIDSRSGDLKWNDEVFGSRIELLDLDGDGIVELLSETDGLVLKIYDVDHKKEKHLQ